MPFFSFDKNKGKPIGIINGGEHDKKIINVCENKNNDKCCDYCNSDCGIKKKLCCNNCENLEGGCDSCDRDDFSRGLAMIFSNELKKIKSGEIDSIEIKDGKMEPIPKCDENQVDHIFIAGPSGAGKSTWASMYIKLWKKIFPNRKFFLISDVLKDEILDKLKPKRIILDERMYEDPIPIDAFKNSLVLFDDIDTIKDENIRDSVKKLRDEILEKGRHNNTNVLSISHNPTNNKATKASLLESSSVVLFPGGGDDFHMRNVLKNYCGIDPKKINDILNLNSRWIQVSKKYPKYILHEKGAFLPK